MQSQIKSVGLKEWRLGSRVGSYLLQVRNYEKETGSYTKHSRNLRKPVTLHSEVHSGLATQSWPSSGNSAVPLREEAELAMIGCALMETHEEISQLKNIGNLNASNDVTAERNLMANKKNNKNVLLFLFKNTNIKNKLYIWNTLFCFVFLFRTLFYALQEMWTYSVTRGKYGGISMTNFNTQ